MRLPANARQTRWLGLGLGLAAGLFLLAGQASSQPRPSSIHEVAHLKAIAHKGTVYVDRGPMIGTFDMTMTLTVDNKARHGTFTAVAPDGSLSGEISVSAGERRVKHGRPVIVFTGSGAIEGGTRAYRGYYAHDLKLTGVIKTGGVLNMTLNGDLHWAPRSRR